MKIYTTILCLYYYTIVYSILYTTMLYYVYTTIDNGEIFKWHDKICLWNNLAVSNVENGLEGREAGRWEESVTAGMGFSLKRGATKVNTQDLIPKSKGGSRMTPRS